MSANAMKLKARIHAYSKESGLTSQVILQNFMFERWLERLSMSDYKDRFIIKGGILVAAIVGLDTRATMDLDTTIKSYPLEEDSIRELITEICGIAVDDDVAFQYIRSESIREDDEYGGIRVHLQGLYDTINVPMKIDISAGDVITPGAKLHRFSHIFDADEHTELWAYNIETVLAEKVETILRRSVFNTRPRDFYDVYVLTNTQHYDKSVFRRALFATAEHRQTRLDESAFEEILNEIETNTTLQNHWSKYRNTYPYAKNIDFLATIQAVRGLLHI